MANSFSSGYLERLHRKLFYKYLEFEETPVAIKRRGAILIAIFTVFIIAIGAVIAFVIDLFNDLIADSLSPILVESFLCL